jgi:hypothetical protein
MELNKQIDVDELKVGQSVYIEFIPHSQKYLDICHPKTGIIYSINKIKYFDDFTNKNETIYDIKIKNNYNKIENLFHDNLSYYGNSLGYSYNIYLVK